MGLRPHQILTFLLLCLLSIGGLSLLAESLWGDQGEVCVGDSPCFRYYTINEVIGYKAFADKREKEIIEAGIIKAEKQEMERQVKAIRSLEDTIRVMELQADRSGNRFFLPGDDRLFWSEIFSEWETLRTKKKLYRIVHYGDSQIEMDRITATLRAKLQRKFGGGGPGLLPPLQLIPAYTIAQSASPTWKRYISYGVSINRYHNSHYGPLGMVFPFDSGYASVSISPRIKGNQPLNRYETVKVIAGRISSPLRIAASGSGIKEQITLQPQENEQMIRWPLGDKPGTINLSFSGDTLSPILAIALDSESGIMLDNIPWRGSSGLTLRTISKSSLITTYKMLGVRMIILQFGGNSVPYLKNEQATINYVKSFGKQISYLLTIDPSLRILVIGPGDMSFNDKGTMATYPFLKLMVAEMKRECLIQGAAFWSMFDAMGGQGSMVQWVNEKPPLAAPDYIHFTQKGSDYISDRLYEAIEREYEIYRKKKGLHEKPAVAP